MWYLALSFSVLLVSSRSCLALWRSKSWSGILLPHLSHLAAFGVLSAGRAIHYNDMVALF